MRRGSIGSANGEDSILGRPHLASMSDNNSVKVISLAREKVNVFASCCATLITMLTLMSDTDGAITTGIATPTRQL